MMHLANICSDLFKYYVDRVFHFVECKRHSALLLTSLWCFSSRSLELAHIAAGASATVHGNPTSLSSLRLVTILLDDARI